MTAADTIAPVHESSARSDAAYAQAVDTSFVASGPSVRAWHPAPGEIVSLWDMLPFDVLEFAHSYQLLESRRIECILHRDLDKLGDSPPPTGDKEEVLALISRIEQPCVFLGLDSAHAQIRRIRDNVDSKDCTYNQLLNMLTDLRNRIADRLDSLLFMFMPTKGAAYWNDTVPFGTEVAAKFPKLNEDIGEASRCMGVGRYTAAVFHLMRVMEAALTRLVKLLQPSINLSRPWGNVLRDISTAIGALPGAPSGPPGTTKEKARHEKFAEVAAYLNHVKDAWRNTTMHPKRTYTEEEAENLFNNVRAFMQALVKLR